MFVPGNILDQFCLCALSYLVQCHPCCRPRGGKCCIGSRDVPRILHGMQRSPMGFLRLHCPHVLLKIFSSFPPSPSIYICWQPKQMVSKKFTLLYAITTLKTTQLTLNDLQTQASKKNRPSHHTPNPSIYTTLSLAFFYFILTSS